MGECNKSVIERTIRIVYDSDAESPREYGSDRNTIVCWHDRYTIGDLQPRVDKEEWLSDKDNAPEGSIILELFLHDHGCDISISAGSRIDAFDPDEREFGYAIMTPDQIRECYGVTEITQETLNSAEKGLRATVDEYSEYLNGNVYGFEIFENTYCECCGNTSSEVVDSCYGFIGATYAEESMREHIDPELHDELREAWTRGAEA